MLIDLAMPSFERSTGGAMKYLSFDDSMFISESGLERSISSYRTSSTAWIDSQILPMHPTLNAIEQRIALLTNLPIKNQVRRQWYSCTNFPPILRRCRRRFRRFAIILASTIALTMTTFRSRPTCHAGLACPHSSSTSTTWRTVGRHTFRRCI